nr:hypothetical protein [bacterium]
MMLKDQALEALAGRPTDRIPFFLNETHYAPEKVRQMLGNNVATFVRRVDSTRDFYPNLIRLDSQWETLPDGTRARRLTYVTPKGNLTTLQRPAGYTNWTLEYPFKSEQDYPALTCLFEGSYAVSNEAELAEAIRTAPEDTFVRDGLETEPLQELISFWMGTETFCCEWMDNRDRVLEVVRHIIALRRSAYPLIAQSPLTCVTFGGNLAPTVIGPQLAREYYFPYYAELKEALAGTGKLVGCHLDADNQLIFEDIAHSALDYIEAFDPSFGIPVSRARRAFYPRSIWLNWPTGNHWMNAGQAREHTFELCRQAYENGGLAGFIVGITETVPAAHRPILYPAIALGLEDARRAFL